MSAHRARRIAVVLASIVLPGVATAQVAMPGARVRVVNTTTGNPVIVGELLRIAGDTVTISTASALAGYVAHSAIVVGGQRRLEVRTAVHDQQLVGALLGGVAGAAIGYTMASGAPDNCDNSFTMCVPPASLGALGGSLVGALAGAIIGKAIRTEEWSRVSRPPVRLAIAPSSKGMLLAASISF